MAPVRVLGNKSKVRAVLLHHVHLHARILYNADLTALSGCLLFFVCCEGERFSDI